MQRTSAQLVDTVLEPLATYLSQSAPSPPEASWTARLVCKRLAELLQNVRTVSVNKDVVVPADAIGWRFGEQGSARSLTYAQRILVVLQAAKSGDAQLLQQTLAAMECLAPTELVEGSARAGLLQACRGLSTCNLHDELPWINVLHGAAASGNLQLVTWVLTRLRSIAQDDLWAMSNPDAIDDFKGLASAVGVAAQAGHGDVCNELLRVSKAPGADRLAAAAGAARGGLVAMMDGLLGGGPWEGSLHDVVAGAGRGCDLATLQRLHGRYREQPEYEEAQQQQQQEEEEEEDAPPNLLAAAVSSPTPDWAAKAQWLLEQGHPRDATCWNLEALAALPDAAERVGWMQREGVAFRGAASLTQATAHKGHVPLLTALLDCGARFSVDDMHEAARQGHAAWLQQLHAKGRLEPSAVLAAAEGGHMELVQWMWGALGLGIGAAEEEEEHGYCVREYLMGSAALSGKQELVAWVRQQGSGWAPATLTNAVSSGCLELVEWLHLQGCPMEETEPYLAAARNGDIAMLEWLKRHHCPYNKSELLGAFDVESVSELALRRWFHNNSFPGKWMHESYEHDLVDEDYYY